MRAKSNGAPAVPKTVRGSVAGVAAAPLRKEMPVAPAAASKTAAPPKSAGVLLVKKLSCCNLSCVVYLLAPARNMGAVLDVDAFWHHLRVGGGRDGCDAAVSSTRCGWRIAACSWESGAINLLQHLFGLLLLLLLLLSVVVVLMFFLVVGILHGTGHAGGARCRA